MDQKTIRSNWDAALCKVENGSDLSEAIGWGFEAQDIIVLCCLHEMGRHREKIEDLLEDCNFHYENDFLISGRYDECRKAIMKEWLE